MNVLFDHEQLLQLITSLHTLTGIRANIFDVHGKDVCLTTDHAPFCKKINACVEGHAKCEGCDTCAIERCSTDEVRFYRCHAGVCEAIMPIFVDGVPVAYLVFGQFLDSSDIERQWRDTEKTLDWYPGDLSELREAFCGFRQYSEVEIAAYTDILKALASYIQLKGMILPSDQTDLQRLARYLDQHYTEKLTLESISSHLHIGRTKLCLLAKKLSGGKTISHIIIDKRINAAKSLLIKSDMSIAAIAETVGISDYNYFSKVFRSAVGVAPSGYRKEHRERFR